MDLKSNIVDLFKFIGEQVIPERSYLQIETLQKELLCLLPLVRSAPSWISVDEDNDVRDLLNRIQTSITETRRGLHLTCDIRTSELERVTFDLLKEIWLLKPDIVLVLSKLGFSEDMIGVLASYIHSLDYNLDYLLKCREDYVAPVKEKLDVIKGNLKHLYGFVSFIRCYSPQSNDFWDYVIAVLIEAGSCISSLCLAEDSDDDMADFISLILVDLLQSINPATSNSLRVYIEALNVLPSFLSFSSKLVAFAADFVNFILQAPITELNSRSYQLAYKDRVQKLQKLLSLLLVYILCNEGEKESLIIFDLVVNEFWSFINSLDNREMDEDFGEEFDLAISRLVRRMDHVEASNIIESTIRSTGLGFSQIDSLGCIDLVSQNLLRLLDHMTDSITEITEQIEVILNEIEIFKPFLEGNIDQQGKLQRDVCNHMTNLFVKSEYIVDELFLVQPYSKWNRHVENVIYEIKPFKNIVEFVHIFMENNDVPSDCQTSKRSTPIIDEEVVGLEDQIEILMARVIGGGAELNTIPIIGMPGIGKTTLAKRIYNDKRTSDHFDIRAWCSVSPRNTVSELAQDILISIVDLSNHIYKKELDYLDLLRRQLHRGRYLVVVDEVWDSDIFDELHRCFPDNHNGSRILVTSSRNNEDPLFDEPLFVRLLTPEESWELLQVKYDHLRFCTQEEFRKPPIPNENCPAEVGKEIAVICQGLPLAIVLVAGFLVNLEGKKSNWLTITGEIFSSKTNRDVGDCNEIIELSYKNMPGYLRQCFLYFAALPMTIEISVSKLTWLWVSEGFLRRDECLTKK